MFKFELVKDGNSYVTQIWYIDPTVPKVYLEDNSYKFNSELIHKAPLDPKANIDSILETYETINKHLYDL